MASLENLRHSAAHLLAAAVMKLWPDTKRTIGPAIEEGFYFDFEFSKPITEADLPKIEEKMREILPNWKSFEKHELNAKEAKKEYQNNQYKHELIDEFSKEGQTLSFYKSGDYWDLCKGGHVENPNKELKHFKLLKLAGAYWRGNEKNNMLTRIYGTAFPKKEELEEYLKRLEEAKKRDHRILGKELDLFFFHEYSPGAPIFLPKGVIIYNELMKLIREEYKKRGYQEVLTPLLYEKTLWETSGHWEHYKEDMFSMESEKKMFSLKPMNCPSHCLIYKHKLWSYKELPLRIADFAPLHRNERSGTLSGLTRVRKFSQDDAHIFLAEEQLEEEIEKILDFEQEIYNKIFKLEYTLTIGTRPDHFMGEQKLWDKAEKILEEILKKKNIKYLIAEKDGAFYGPKIDLKVKDALHREWQLATIQVDFQIPLRFELTFEGKDGKKHTPIMIHRAMLGSLERFIALLVENDAGKFPLWLAPVQVVLMTLTDRNLKYAKRIKEELEKENIRTEVDDRSESIGKKVRDHQLMKIPLMITLGDKESENKTLAIRTLEGKTTFGIQLQDFLTKVKKNILEKETKISFE